MRGFQLSHARSLRRIDLRRAAISEGTTTGAFLALDEEELIALAGLDNPGARGNAVKLALLARGLVASAMARDKIALALHRTPKEVEAMLTARLVDETGIAARIDEEVIRDLPETAEPRRHVEPVRDGVWAAHS